MTNELRTLGFLVSHHKIRPDPAKIDMLRKALVPTDKTELKRFLGLLQFYRNMLPQLGHSVHRLYKLTSKKVKFEWTKEINDDYLAIKDMVEKDIMQNSLEGDDDVKTYHDASRFAVCTYPDSER